MIDPKSIERIAKKYELELVYLFGSKSTATDSKLSDIDIAVLAGNYRTDILKDLMLNLVHEFTKLFGSDKIDLLILNEASLAIQYRVISEGKLLYQDSPERRYQYEEKTVKLYLDFRKFEEEYYESLHKHILGE
ncbi:MAG: type VII toxin-antitoxin system MntA family adenylyltransferase antitoxin [Promethearchaeia archaeon]